MLHPPLAGNRREPDKAKFSSSAHPYKEPSGRPSLGGEESEQLLHQEGEKELS